MTAPNQGSKQLLSRLLLSVFKMHSDDKLYSIILFWWLVTSVFDSRAFSLEPQSRWLISGWWVASSSRIRLNSFFWVWWIGRLISTLVSLSLRFRSRIDSQEIWNFNALFAGLCFCTVLSAFDLFWLLSIAQKSLCCIWWKLNHNRGYPSFQGSQQVLFLELYSHSYTLATIWVCAEGKDLKRT